MNAGSVRGEPDAPDATRNRRGRARLWGGPLLLAGLVLLFLAEPIVRFRSSHYSFADFVQYFSLIQLDPSYVRANRQMGDPAVMYLPWTLYSRDELQAGRFPLWNPHNGGGVPHLANYQSAILSPYNLPFYLLGLKSALLVSAFLKLFALALFTFLFLRSCGLDRAAALLGATGYTFAGYHVAWVSGAITSTAATLPAALYFSELVLQRSEAAPRNDTAPKLALPLAGLTLSLAAGLLAGHPENLYFGGLLLTGYLGFRLWRIRRSMPGRALALLAGRFLCCAVAAAVLSAVQVLPFLEYLLNSQVLTGRSGLSAGLTSRPFELWPLLLVPQALGNAASAYYPSPDLSTPFPEAIAPYTGPTILFLGLLALSLLRSRARVRFFAAVMAVWLIYTFNPWGVAAVFRAVPGVSLLPINRSHDIWLFAVSAAAAYLLDAVLRRRSEVPRPAVMLVAGLGVLAAGLIGARLLVGKYGDAIGPQGVASSAGESAYFAWTFGLGLGAIMVAAVARRESLRRAAAVSLSLVVFLQTGFLLRDFNPTIEDRLVYPVTPEMRELQQTVGRATLVIAGGPRGTLFANANLVYRLSLPNNYDSIWIRRFDELYRRRFGDSSFPRSPVRFDTLGLQLFGIDYVLGKAPFINSEFADRRGLALSPEVLGPLGPRGAIQVFRAAEDDLQAVALYVRCAGGPLHVRVESVADPLVIARRDVPCAPAGPPRWVTIRFPAIPDSRGKTYRVLVDRSGAEHGESTLYAWANVGYPDGELTWNGGSHGGALAFDFAYDLDAFEPVTALKDRRLYRFLGGRSRYYTVGQAVLIANDEDVLRALEAEGFDAGETVVLSDPPRHLSSNRAPAAAGQVEIASETATRIDLTVTRPDPGYLVLAKPDYPGWDATVDGSPAPLLRANYAFMAVEVPAGTSRVVVSYQPWSVRWGVVLSLAALIAGCLWVGWRVRYSER